MLNECPGLDRFDQGANGFRLRSDNMPIICGQLDDRNFSAFEILLVSQVLIRSDEKIKFRFSQEKEVPIFHSTPSAFLRV